MKVWIIDQDAILVVFQDGVINRQIVNYIVPGSGYGLYWGEWLYRV